MPIEPRDRFNVPRDALALLAGWLVLLLIDPPMAIAVGVPLGVPLLAAVAYLRRRPRADRQGTEPERERATGERRLPFVPGVRCRIRLAAAVAFPLVVIPLTACLVLGCPAPIAAFSLLLALFIAIEIRKRRRGSSALRRAPVLSALLFVVTSYTLALWLLELGWGARPTEAFIKKLSRAQEAPKWSPDAGQQAMRAVRVLLADRAADRISSADAAIRLAEELRESVPDLVTAPSPEGIFVTLYDDRGGRARGFSNQGAGSLQKVLGAAAAAITGGSGIPGPRPNPAREQWQARSRSTRIQIDVSGRSRPLARRPLFRLVAPLLRASPHLAPVDALGEMVGLGLEIEPGVDGLRLQLTGADATAVVLPSDPVTHGWLTPRVRSAPAKLQAMLTRAAARDLGVKLVPSDADFRVSKFKTTSFAQPRPGDPTVELYRGNVLLGERLERNLLVERTIAAANWLSRQVRRTADSRTTGRFRYESYPPYRRETADYNLPRHAGSVYGLLALHDAALQEPAFAGAAERALRAGLESLGYITRNLGAPPSGESGMLCFLEGNGYASSGATALAAIAVAELPDPEQIAWADLRERVRSIPVNELLSGMGQCMLAMIDPDGAVFWGYREASARRYVQKEPLYFPGEVMLALVRGYRRTGDRTLLQGAIRIGDRQLRRYRPFSAVGLPVRGDHWIIQALAEVAEATGEKRYAEVAVLMGKGYLREQHPPTALIYPDYLGSYFRFIDLPRTTRAASRGEALGGAVRAARFTGRDPSRLQEALVRGARHLIEQQFMPANSYFVPRGFDLHGAVRMGLVDNHCRIDNNQHALIALLNALRAMDNR